MNIHMMGMNIVMSIMVTNMLMKRTFTAMSMPMKRTLTAMRIMSMNMHMTVMNTAMSIMLTNMPMTMDRTAPAAATIMITITTTMPMKFSQAGEKKLLMYSPEK